MLALVGILIGGSADLLLRSTFTDAFDGAARTLLDFPINSEAFLLIFLPILVFQGALAIDVRRLSHEAATVLLLAVVAVVVSTAAIGLALFPFAHMSIEVCLLVGVIVATTDPSAVVGIFRDIGAATRLTRLVEGEALLNDAAAISIFAILLKRRHQFAADPAGGRDHGLRDLVRRRPHRRRGARPADPVHDHRLRRHPGRRGHADHRAALYRLYRQRRGAASLGRGGDRQRRADLLALRALDAAAADLAFPRGAVGAAGVLGRLAGVRAGLDAGAAAAGRADRVGLRADRHRAGCRGCWRAPRWCSACCRSWPQPGFRHRSRCRSR